MGEPLIVAERLRARSATNFTADVCELFQERKFEPTSAGEAGMQT
jgi:hypothetical protein